jgi:UDP-glucose 4-epimerase
MTRKRHEPKATTIDVVELDLLDDETLSLSPERVGRIDAVFHLAAIMPNGQTDAEAYKRANGAATKSLITQCVRHGIPNFVYCSSIGVIGTPKTRPIDMSHPVNPLHPYFTGKLLGEEACKNAAEQGLTTHIFRLTSPYGPQMPRHSVLPLFVSKAITGQPISWHGSGSRAQDFIYIQDILTALLSAADTKKSGSYCLGSGKATSMMELAEVIALLIPGTRMAPSGQIDPQEGVVWEADITPLAQQFHLPTPLSIQTGLECYIANLSEPPETWWLP